MSLIDRMTRRRLHIRIDVDGVVYDLVKEMLPLLSELAGRPIREEHIVEFHIPRALGLTITNKQVFMSNRRLFNMVAERGLYWTAPKPMRMAKKSIQKIRDAGHEVSLVTSRPKRLTVAGREIDVEAETRKWHRHHFGDDLKLDVLGEDVDELVEKVSSQDRADLFIDDDPQALALVRRVHRKTVPVAFDKPWNRSWGGDRVSDWTDLYHFVNAVSNRLKSVLE